jgi:hypothetical protein
MFETFVAPTMICLNLQMLDHQKGESTSGNQDRGVSFNHERTASALLIQKLCTLIESQHPTTFDQHGAHVATAHHHRGP